MSARPRLRYLRAITEEIDRLGRWLHGLLDTVRPFKLNLVPVDLNAVVEEVVTLLRSRLDGSGIEVQRRMASNLPKLTADEVQLQQALLGVLENSVDALATGGTIAVETELLEVEAPRAVRITIRDTGQGIPADHLGRVFDLFFTTKSRGTGLGLAITRTVVERHGGRVEVESQPGAGTTVRIVLPAEAPATEATT